MEQRRNWYNGRELGPLLPEDMEFLKTIIKMTTPKILVEFGHLFGDSARGMLEVMDADAHLYSVDKDRDSGITDPRFTYFKQSQELPIPVKEIDFVFLDASHELDLNIKTLDNLDLSEGAIIAVHDTGTWPSNVYNFDRGETISNGRYAHCPEEIDFVNWLLDNRPEYNQIHFHSNRDVRHGITLLQKKYRLTR